MARRKNLSTLEKITEVERQINEVKENLSNLQLVHKELLEQKKQEEMIMIYSLIENNGMTVEQAMNILSSKPTVTKASRG